MKSRRKWQMSHGGLAVFLGWLLVLFILEFALRTVKQGPAVWTSWLMGGLTLLCVWAFWRLVWKKLREQSRWREPRSWWEGSFLLVYLLLGYAAVVFIFGRTPSKYGNGQPIPRSAGWYYVSAAALPFAIGSVAYGREKLKFSRSSPDRPTN